MSSYIYREKDMDKATYINDLIEGVDLNASTSTLAPASFPQPKVSKIEKQDVVSVKMSPQETENGEVYYHAYVENSNSSLDKDAATESFTNYEKDTMFTPYNEDMDLTTKFYVASLTVIGLYIFFRLIQRGR